MIQGCDAWLACCKSILERFSDHGMHSLLSFSQALFSDPRPRSSVFGLIEFSMRGQRENAFIGTSCATGGSVKWSILLGFRSQGARSAVDVCKPKSSEEQSMA